MLGLAPSNGRIADGTHDGEMGKLRIGDRNMANDPRDSRREDKLIMGCVRTYVIHLLGTYVTILCN